MSQPGEPPEAQYDSTDRTQPDAAREALFERLNRECHCITIDQVALRRALEAELVQAGLPRPLFESHPHLFAESPVFLSRQHVARIAEIIRDVESLAQHEAYREMVRAWAPEIAEFDPGTPGVFFGYDFHLGQGGPQLIEINTNAGGALFNAYLAGAQQACCPEVDRLLVSSAPPESLAGEFLSMFRREWALQHPDRSLQRVAIVDDAPREQPMYSEFVLFQRLFEGDGIEARVVDARELDYDGDTLSVDGDRIDLVYNRLCDFYLEAPEHAALRQAYLHRAAVITPHPRAYALYADKRNLTLLSNPALLRRAGMNEATAERLASSVPEATPVTGDNADALWAKRRGHFFKPVTGFGSRGAYRGDKLTRRVWQSIISGGYIAQKLVQPSVRHFALDDGTTVLKVDLRAYSYAGTVQFLAARLYRGQTTNLRSPGGGFAPVYTEAQAI